VGSGAERARSLGNPVASDYLIGAAGGVQGGRENECFSSRNLGGIDVRPTRYECFMARERKRHQQQELRFLDKNGQRRGRIKGDKRWRNAGRKPKGKSAGSPHAKRPELKSRYPVHVVLRVHADIGSLRKRHLYVALREATLTLGRRELYDVEVGWFRIVHVSIQGNHVHLLVEAADKQALSSGMQSFQISAAKHINREHSRRAGLRRRRRGSVFPDRFHQEIITTPQQARRALSYVMNNWRKHREDRDRSWNVDPFSTGALFPGWKEHDGAPWMWRWRESYDPLFVYRPRTWLLRAGWQRAGTISFRAVPSRV
jgi:REP element-mobilizing transposase RayT